MENGAIETIEIIRALVQLVTLGVIVGSAIALSRRIEGDPVLVTQQLERLTARYERDGELGTVAFSWDWVPVRKKLVGHVQITASGERVPYTLQRDRSFDLTHHRLGPPMLETSLAALEGESPPPALLWLDQIWDCLDLDARVDLDRATARGMWLEQGVLGVDLRLEWDRPPLEVYSEVEAAVLALLGAQAALDLDLSSCSCLSGEADWALSPATRLRRLRRRCNYFIDEPETLTACEVALARGSSLEQVVAARFLGTEALQQIVDRLEPHSLPAELWLRSRAALEAFLSPEQLWELLDQDLSCASEQTISALLGELGDRAGPVQLELLQRVVEHHLTPELIPALTQLFTTLPGGAGEPLLGTLLAKSYPISDERAEQLKLAMVRSLGSMGTSAAVKVLQTYQRSHYITLPLLRAARDAVKQARALADAHQGQLSLAGAPEGGALSLSEVGGELGLED